MNAQKFSLIIVDDEYTILERLEKTINWEELGVELVASADNGKKALEEIIKHQPDIVVMDIRMPYMLGTEVIRRARSAGVRSEFVVLSGYDDFLYAQEAMKYGVRGYLLKPLSTVELYDEVQKICLEKSREEKRGNTQYYLRHLSGIFLSRLINSSITELAVVTNSLIEYDLNIVNRDCFVMVLLLKNLDMNKKEVRLNTLNQTCTLLNGKLILGNFVFWVNNEEQIVGIVNVSNRTHIEVAAECTKFFLSQEMEIPLIGIGDLVDGLIRCSYSYNRALIALSYQMYDERTNIFTYDMICTIPPNMSIHEIDYLPLVQCIVKRDIQGIREYCSGFFVNLFYVSMPSPNYVYSMCYTLVRLIEQEFTEFSYAEIQEITNPQEIYMLNSMGAIRERVEEKFLQLSDVIDAIYGFTSSQNIAHNYNVDDNKDELIQVAVAYVREHIARQLKIVDVANHVHLSASYFAVYFKNKTSINLRDYLTFEKMAYARKRLLDSSNTVNDIAQQIGYGDYRSFSRAFKSIHGITPTEFQSKHK